MEGLSNDSSASSLHGTSHGYSSRSQYESAPQSLYSESLSSRIRSPTSLSQLPEDGEFDQRIPQTPIQNRHRESRAGSDATKRPYSSSSQDGGNGRASLDPSVRPTSMMGEKKDAPWIGTFNFEGQDNEGGTARDSALQKEVGSESESNDMDIEKQKDGVDQDTTAVNGEERDPNLVDFDGPDDPDDPKNWSPLKKWYLTVVLGMLTFTIAFASSIFSTTVEVTSEKFGVSTEVMTLGTSLFVLGFAWGPPVWGPISELYGRKYPLFFGYFIFAIFSIATAVSQTLYSVLITRFFGGFFGSAPLGIVGGALADFHDPVARGYALSIFSGASFVGPAASPVVGSFVTYSYLGWRWTEWLTSFLAFAVGAVAWFSYPESFVPTLLQQKAKRLRHQTRNWAIHSEKDEEQVNFGDIVTRYIARPFAMLTMEPILLAITLYMSLIYGILYSFFGSFPIAFQEVRGYAPGVGSLPFLSFMIGPIFGALIIGALTATRFKRRYLDGTLTPEERLVPMFIGGILMPAGLFWFAWTSSPNISPWPQIVSILAVGAGILIIFMQGLNYIIDVYAVNANSAIAANTFVRSFVGAGFPLFTTYMYHRLGVNWASSLLGFLCLAMYPFPILFFFFGKKIRSWSRYVPQH